MQQILDTYKDNIEALALLEAQYSNKTDDCGCIQCGAPVEIQHKYTQHMNNLDTIEQTLMTKHGYTWPQIVELYKTTRETAMQNLPKVAAWRNFIDLLHVGQ